MDEDTFDQFLDDATMAVYKEWQKVKGRALKEGELYAINDLLTQFFADKRE